jgi:hypothetical protein
MLTMMSSSTSLNVVRAQRQELGGSNGQDAFEKDRQWAEQLGREISRLLDATLGPEDGPGDDPDA